ncbi:MAG: hypothetical protein PWR29_655 [Methanolobus sp.]|jgi:hypothetical protein|nr:hypothetical protein [Methanolobus sp.]MDK2833416.1 hypothetical protein [Methanolobus sp.]MDK2911698.1 hypothetical protein [Methanolobus sp.]MDN5308809.1 hypothetical protein [Methanolobus sp.]
MKETIEWDIDVGILTNRFIMLEVGRALFIAFLFTAMVISIIMLPSLVDGSLISAGVNTSGFGYLLLMIGLLFLFTAVFIVIYYGNSYMLSYTVDEKGVRTLTRKEQRSRNRVANTLLIIAGMLSRSPSVAGAGMIAAGRQDQFLRWKDVRKVVFHPKYHTIVLRGGYGIKSIIFCTQERYDPVSLFVKSQCRTQ